MKAVLSIILLAVAIYPTFSLKEIDSFNLFISKEEMLRTLGIWAEMNYVNDGEINEYSTKFPYRVVENVTHLSFGWNNSNKRINLRYAIEASSKNFDVLPILHFPPEGIIPRKSESIEVEFRCVGARSGQFKISLKFNITAVGHRSLIFTLKQEKICTTMDGRRMFAGDQNIHKLSSDSVLPIGIGSAVAVLFIVIVVFCIYFLRIRRENQAKANRFRKLSTFRESLRRHLRMTNNLASATTTTFQAASNKGENEKPVPLDSPFTPLLDQQPSTSTAPYPTGSSTNEAGILSSTNDAPNTANIPRIIFERRDVVIDINNALIELNADRNLFEVNRIPELEGSYSEVVYANWRQIGMTGTAPLIDEVDDQEDDVTGDTALICKTLKHGAERRHFERFLRDALQFHNVPPDHNLAQVMAAATFGNFNNPDSVKDLPLICYKHSGFGFLKKFLQTCRRALSHSFAEPDEDSAIAGSSLRTHDLLSMALQILSAIQHLHTFGVIHKDIATRNCLVSNKFVNKIGGGFHVQLCDNALSRDIFAEEYYKPADAPEGQDEKPVKWMAPECILSNIFTSSSDVWSFGVLIWELLTCGQLPYSELDMADQNKSLLSGYRLSQPTCCPDALYSIMESCWNYEATKRPIPSELEKALKELSTELKSYI